MLEQMKQEVFILNNLLSNPEEGCFTWHEAVNQQIEKINKIYYGDKK